MDTSTVVVERDKGGRRKVRRRTYTLDQEPRQLERVNDDGRIEITLAGDIRLCIIGSVAPERVEQVITLLRRAS
jgi:hypothetical protein